MWSSVMSSRGRVSPMTPRDVGIGRGEWILVCIISSSPPKSNVLL